MKKGIFILLCLLLMVWTAAIPSDTISARPVSSPELSPPFSTQIFPPDEDEADEEADTKAHELELVKSILDQLKKAKEATEEDDKEARAQIDKIRQKVKSLQNLVERQSKAALKLKWEIVRRVEKLLASRPSVERCDPPSLHRWKTTKLYDELTGVLMKLHELIASETPPEEPEEPEHTLVPKPKEIEGAFVYSVDYFGGSTFGERCLPTGTYYTAINIHNPSTQTVTLWMKAAEANPVDEPRGKICPYQKVTLGPGEAIAVDCFDVVKLLGVSPQPVAFLTQFTKGFFVILCSVEQDIDAVYGIETPNGPVFQVNRVSPSSAGIVPTAPIPTDEDIARPTTDEAAPPTAVTPAPSEVTPSPPEEEAAKLGEIIIDPASDSNEVGTMHSITIKVFDTGGSPVPNAKVHVSQSGAHTGTIALVTGTDGKAGYYYIGQNAGTDTIVVTVDNLSASAIKEWYIPETEQPETGPAKWTPPTTEPADLTPTTESDLAE